MSPGIHHSPSLAITRHHSSSLVITFQGYSSHFRGIHHTIHTFAHLKQNNGYSEALAHPWHRWLQTNRQPACSHLYRPYSIQVGKFDLPVPRATSYHASRLPMIPTADRRIKFDDSELLNPTTNFELQPPEDNPTAPSLDHGIGLENVEIPPNKFTFPPMGTTTALSYYLPAPSGLHRTRKIWPTIQITRSWWPTLLAAVSSRGLGWLALWFWGSDLVILTCSYSPCSCWILPSMSIRGLANW